MTYFHMANATLSSALKSFTSEFGMGSGGSYLPLPPSKLAFINVTNDTKKNSVNDVSSLLIALQSYFQNTQPS